MDQDSKKPDTANEPVDKASDDDFMDTGVLHEQKTPVAEEEDVD